MTTLDQLRDHIDHRLDDHEKSVAADMKAQGAKVDEIGRVVLEHIVESRGMNKAVDKLAEEVWGNGKLGYKVRIDRLERWRTRLQWVGTGVLAPLVLYVAYMILQKVFLDA